MWRTQGPFKGWGTTMRSRKQFAIRLVVALGIAFVGMGAIGTVIAFSAVERARMIAEEAIIKPFRPPVPKAEYRLSDQQQLRRIFLGR
jgi:hypothetical protein